MIMESSENFLKNVLGMWLNADTPAINDNHLTDSELYNLASDHGLQHAEVNTLEHLSLCPTCMRAWLEWKETLEILEEQEEEKADEYFATGLLRAASASLYSEPLSLPSSCGRFELTIFPDMEANNQAMVVLEVVESQDMFNGVFAVVRDGSSRVILQGTIEDARCAGRINELNSLDLKTWTVHFDH